MANHQMFDPNAMNAAMRHVPFGTVVTVILADNPNSSITVTVTDRGPFVVGRVIDLTPAAFIALVGSTAPGIVRVVVMVP
jgi:rare lipoprotein A